MFYYGIVLHVIGIQPFEQFTASTALRVLESLGVHGNISSFQEPIIISVQKSSIQLSELCTGMLETILLAAAILASVEISWKKRVVGIVAGIFAAQAFNLVRVVATIENIISTSQAFAELTHDVLFRLSLLVVIAGFYFVWLKWALGEKPNGFRSQKRRI